MILVSVGGPAALCWPQAWLHPAGAQTYVQVPIHMKNKGKNVLRRERNTPYGEQSAIIVCLQNVVLLNKNFS